MRVIASTICPVCRVNNVRSRGSRVYSTCSKSCGGKISSAAAVEKRKKAALEKYGVDHHMKTANRLSVCRKRKDSRKLSKEEIIALVRSRRIPSNVSKIIEHLISSGISKDDILVGKTRFVLDCDKLYFPSIFIKSRNLIIDVKTTASYDKDLSKIEKIKTAAIEKGYDFKVVVWNAKHSRIDQIIE